jgi:hypothetical protein
MFESNTGAYLSGAPVEFLSRTPLQSKLLNLTNFILGWKSLIWTATIVYLAHT